MEGFRRREQEYHKVIEKAAIGENLAGKAPRCGSDPRPGVACPGEEEPPPDILGGLPPDGLETAGADQAFLEGRYMDAALGYAELLAAEKGRVQWQSQAAAVRDWRAAVLHLKVAQAWRRGRQLAKALDSINAALQVCSTPPLAASPRCPPDPPTPFAPAAFAAARRSAAAVPLTVATAALPTVQGGLAGAGQGDVRLWYSGGRAGGARAAAGHRP